jgi:hypothetical protein
MTSMERLLGRLVPEDAADAVAAALPGVLGGPLLEDERVGDRRTLAAGEAVTSR